MRIRVKFRGISRGIIFEHFQHACKRFIFNYNNFFSRPMFVRILLFVLLYFNVKKLCFQCEYYLWLFFMSVHILLFFIAWTSQFTITYSVNIIICPYHIILYIDIVPAQMSAFAFCCSIIVSKSLKLIFNSPETIS